MTNNVWVREILVHSDIEDRCIRVIETDRRADRFSRGRECTTKLALKECDVSAIADNADLKW
jgi:hypothetical protein